MTIIRQKTLYTGRVITLNLETVKLPNGHVADLEIIHHPGGAAIAALDDEGRVCLLRQFRHAAGGWIWELPAGKLEPAEPPLHTAQRELLEEAGREADNWLALGSYVSSPGVFTEVVHLFLATGLRKGNISHEPAEAIEIHWIDFDEACARALNGEITSMHMAQGRKRTPVSSGEYPSTNWKYCVMRNVDPNIAKKINMIPELAAENRGFRKNCTSSIG